MLEPLGGGEYGPKTFYGWLEHIYATTSPVGCPDLQITHLTTCIIACIHWCKIKKDHPWLVRLNIHLYREGDDTRIDITDITSIQCLVGCVRDGPNNWAIIDHSGTLARAVYLGGESSRD